MERRRVHGAGACLRSTEVYGHAGMSVQLSILYHHLMAYETAIVCKASMRWHMFMAYV